MSLHLTFSLLPEETAVKFSGLSILESPIRENRRKMPERHTVKVENLVLHLSMIMEMTGSVMPSNRRASVIRVPTKRTEMPNPRFAA